MRTRDRNDPLAPCHASDLYVAGVMPANQYRPAVPVDVTYSRPRVIAGFPPVMFSLGALCDPDPPLPYRLRSNH